MCSSDLKLVVMFARNAGPRAERRELPVAGLLDEIEAFFAQRIEALSRAGVSRERIVLDPGMGFFLGAGIEPSLCVLQNLPRLRRLGYPLLVSVSRKSFLGSITGRSVHERGAASLAAELFAAEQGVDWIRTHDPMALVDGLRVASALRTPGRTLS